jgi:hypothetical protein
MTLMKYVLCIYIHILNVLHQKTESNHTSPVSTKTYYTRNNKIVEYFYEIFTTYKIKIRSKVANGWGNGNACSVCSIFLDNTESKSSVAVDKIIPPACSINYR